jgi:putative phage-type endonuclease
MSLSPEQLAERLTAITATDISAVVGCNPFRSPMDVFLEKRGERPPFVETARSRWGHKLEKPIRQEYEELHNVRVEVPGTLTHPRHPWWKATPDGIVYPAGSSEPDRGLEIKVHGRDAIIFGRLEYGDPGTDEVPPHELLQCMWGMGTTGLPRWDLVPFLDGAPAEYIIDRDEELIGLLGERAERFYVDHILTGNPPEPDGSKAWDDFLKNKWKKNTEDFIPIDSEPAVLGVVQLLREARELVANGETQVDQIRQKLELFIGERAGLSFMEPGRKKPSILRWKRNKPGRKVDYIAIMSDMRHQAALAGAGKAVIFDRAIAALASMRSTIEIGAGASKVTAGELGELLVLVQSTLRDISRASTEAERTREVPGARPFVAPRHWKTNNSDRKNDEEGN